MVPIIDKFSGQKHIYFIHKYINRFKTNLSVYQHAFVHVNTTYLKTYLSGWLWAIILDIMSYQSYLCEIMFVNSFLNSHCVLFVLLDNVFGENKKKNYLFGSSNIFLRHWAGFIEQFGGSRVWPEAHRLLMVCVAPVKSLFRTPSHTLLDNKLLFTRTYRPKGCNKWPLV